jgi:hypothetical protein
VLSALAARRRVPARNRDVGLARTLSPHGLHAACTGRLDGASTTPLRHPARATRSRPPRRPPNSVAAVQARTSPSPPPMPRLHGLDTQGIAQRIELEDKGRAGPPARVRRTAAHNADAGAAALP